MLRPGRFIRPAKLYMTTAMLMASIGLLLAGPLAERVGVAYWFASSGALMAATGFWPASRGAGVEGGAPIESRDVVSAQGRIVVADGER